MIQAAVVGEWDVVLPFLLHPHHPMLSTHRSHDTPFPVMNLWQFHSPPIFPNDVPQLVNLMIQAAIVGEWVAVLPFLLHPTTPCWALMEVM
jgi:hypothetical protein